MAKIPLSEALPILKDTIIHNLRHQDYDYVNLMAKDFTMYSTGVGIKEKLKRFNGGETPDMFQQREILTMTNVADIVNSCVKPLNKASRTPATILMNWKDKDATLNNTNREKVNEVQKKFWGKRSVKEYLVARTGPTDSQDPNSFLVVEFKESIDPKNPNKQQPNPYPFEVNSKEAINYVYKNNELQWLIVRTDLKILDDKDQLVDGEKLYLYKDLNNITATQIHNKKIQDYMMKNSHVILDSVVNYDLLTPGVNYILSTGEKEESKRRYYVINVFYHGIPFVPAQRFGSITDPLKRHRVCTPIITPAKSYFEDSIQTMSEFSITKRLHTFPQKWQYLPKCDKCYNGKSRLDGKTECKECKGTGTVTHSSAQDIVGIKMPDELKDVVNLDLMATYKGPQIDLVKFQKEFGFEDLRRYAQSAVYNNEVGRRRVKTATESEIDSEAVNDTLKPYADNFSSLYEFVFNCIAYIIDLGEGFDIMHQFPDDLQIQTMSEILDDLKKANETGAPSHIRKSLQQKLTRKVYIDQPTEILKFDTKNKYYPFPGKSETEIQFIIANGKTTKYASTLYAHFDLIFADLEYESRQANKDFYQLDEKLQRSLVQAKVADYIKLIDSETSSDASQEFGASGADIETPVDLEAEAKAKLKGSVGGVQGILEIQTSVGLGTTTYEAGVATLIEIYGFDEAKAKRILGEPKKITQTTASNV